MNKHIKNLSLGFLLSVILGIFVFSLSNKLEFSGYAFGGVIGGGVSVFFISLVVAGVISSLFMIFQKSFSSVFYKVFWFIFLLSSFFVLVGSL